MARVEAFATKLPVDLKETLDQVCEKLGLRKNFVVESALREKLEDLLDTYDLEEAIGEATGFHSWENVKKGLGLAKK
jgi:predicted DNA-binding protein